MIILIFNCGSSSQSARLYQTIPGQSDPLVIGSFKATSVDTPSSAEPQLVWQLHEMDGVNKFPRLDHKQAVKAILQVLRDQQIDVDAVGHRFVHGGDRFTSTTLIDDAAMARLQECFPLAPIHNPNSYSVIEVCRVGLPKVPQYVVFDTAFHAGMAEDARTYALPLELAQKNGYHKYGFHGLSCQYVSAKAAELLEKPLDQVKLIICHLGTGGSSVTAFSEGRTLDTSMGYSPLAGLVMSTRCGDVDPGILIDMMRKGYSADEIEKILNTRSGLIGLSGYSSNLSEVIERSETGDKTCLAAYEVYVLRLRHYLGAFSWLLNGANAIVFTDSIGVSSWRLRESVCTDAENLGVILDRSANRTANTAADPDKVTWIHDGESAIKILVMQTDEERVILEEVLRQR